MNITILLIGDPEVAEMVNQSLGGKWSVSFWMAATKQDVAKLDYDLIVVETTITGKGRFNLLCRIRPVAKAPIVVIFNSDKVSDTDMAAALNAGADMCVGTPFSNGEFLARVWAILRRTLSLKPPKLG